MNKSLGHLPKEKRAIIRQIANDIVAALPDMVEMVILYGSYARGNYVEYDERIEFGIRTVFISDYDILVITNENYDGNMFSMKIEEVQREYYNRQDSDEVPTLEVIHDGIKYFTKALEKGLYFYTDIKKEGVLLYNAGNYKLPRRKKINYEEIHKLTTMYYEEKFALAKNFLKHAYIDFKDKEYKVASFYLHQTMENLYKAILLTFTLYTKKEHRLTKLSAGAQGHVVEVCQPFPRNTEEEEALFKMLHRAYIQARYNPAFKVTEEEIKLALERVEILKEITQKACEEKIADYSKYLVGEK